MDELLSEENIGHGTLFLEQLQINFDRAMEKVSSHVQATWKMDLLGDPPPYAWLELQGMPLHQVEPWLLDYESRW